MVILKKIIKKQTPQYLHFRCGMTHLNYSLKILGETFEISKQLLKTEMNHDEIDENNWKDKANGYLILKMMFSVLLTHTLDILIVCKKQQIFG